MKYLALTLCVLASFVAFSQDKNSYYFNLTWPDNSVSRITVNEYLDIEGDPSFYSLVADNAIEFNAKDDALAGYKKLNPNNENYPDNDTLTFFSGSEELFLNKDWMDESYYLQAMSEGFIRFRSSANPEIKGRIEIYALNYLECVQPIPDGCMEYKHIPAIEFRSYQFNGSSESTYIQLAVITGIGSKVNQAIEVVPNPVTSSVTISGAEGETFYITSAEGITVKEQIPANTATDLSDLKPGVYFVQGKNTGFVGKLVKN